ncbi:MAG: PHP domain-containing protein [Oligoflexia bacterium]|nr:PHP domain-containing protein [Oligoflexia bacterium]
MTVADIHIHTIFSPDSTITPEQLISKASKLKIDIVCITDHNIFNNSINLEYYMKNSPPLIIRGVELATKNGELLIFGLKKDFWNDLIYGVEVLPSVESVIDAMDSFDGVAIWAHPFRSYMVQHYDIDYAKHTRIKILEGMNGRNSDMENNNASIYAKQHDFRETGGSDAHRADEIGKCLTLFKDDIKSEDEFIYALKNSEYIPITFGEYKGKDLSNAFKNCS